MKIYRNRQQMAQDPKAPTGAAAAIGNFDGVHRGHQALIALAKTRAQQSQSAAGVLTFDPHPARYFAPDLAPPTLSPLPRKLELLEETGLDFTVVEPFGAALADMSAEDFVNIVLARDLGLRHVIVGFHFHFGKGRKGDPDMLKTLGKGVGLQVDVVSEVTVAGMSCSSTKIREFVLEGRVEGAQMLLGRPFEVTGRVEKGAQRGRTLGFPTANLVCQGDLLPKPGVYAAWVQGVAGDGVKDLRCAAAVNVGHNPTFTPDGKVQVEAHLIDFVGNLYDTTLRVHFATRLRDEKRFDNVDALVAQMRQDVDQARTACPAD